MLYFSLDNSTPQNLVRGEVMSAPTKGTYAHARVRYSRYSIAIPRERVLLKQDTPPFGAKAFGFQSGFAGTICPLGHTIPVPLGTGMHGSYLITIVIKLSELIIK